MFLEATTKIVRSIGRALSQSKVTGYLCGDLLKYQYTNQSQHLRDNVIDIILDCNDGFDTHSLYHNLSLELTINSEIENSDTQYHVISDGYILRFELYKNFDPKSQESVEKFARFTIDALFQNINTNDTVDYSGQGISHLKSDKVVIQSIISPNHWDLRDYLGFAVKVSQFEKAAANPKQLSDLKQKDLMSVPELAEYSFRDAMLEILLAYEPGRALQFIDETYEDGRGWTFVHLVDFMSSLNVPIKEGITSDELFSEKKLKLLNIYNEFYLLDKHRAETPEERTSRLHTTMRLMLDTPTLKIDIPYIDRVSVVTASVMSSTQPTKFEALEWDPLCPYGICPPCDPEKCDPQCCCCDAVDIIRDAKARCHKQITLSCAVDAAGNVTGFDIPPYDPNDPYQGDFPPGSSGVEACETVLAIRSPDPRTSPTYCENWEAIGATELWWTIPSVYWPCTCHCASTLVGAPGDCELTCVTCDDFFCGSEADVRGHDCFYNIDLTPGDGCCGSPAITDWMFVIDFSGSMSDEINQVRTEIGTLVDKLSAKGIGLRLGLCIFGASDPEPFIDLPLTDDVDAFKNALLRSPNGKTEWDIEATFFAATQADWRGHANYIVLIGDEASQFRDSGSCGGSGECTDNTIAILNWFNITVYVADLLSPDRQLLADSTNGKRYDILGSFADLVDDLDIAVYPTSCKCIDDTPVPITRDLPECRCSSFDHNCLSNLPDFCYDIPIGICYPDDDECDCSLPTDLYACGATLLIQPGEESNLVCCSELNSAYGLGCDCENCEEEPCCGPDCFNICEEFPNEQFPWGTEAGRRAIVDSVWLDCWDKKAAVDTNLYPNCSNPCCPDGASPGDRNFPCSRLRDPTDPACQGSMQQTCQDLLAQGICCDCPDFDDCCNCCLLFPDGNCGLTVTHCFNNVRDQTVDTIINVCLGGDITEPPPTWEPPSLKCMKDRCIVGEPNISPSDRDSIDQQCDSIYKGDTPVHHPSVVVLNNGIGLVAYERHESTSSTIKIQQFKTTVQEKVMPNREFNFGRLQNRIRWETQGGESYRSGKLYYYEEIPQHLVSSESDPDPNNPDSWGDAIVFRNGPLEKQFFPLAPTPLGSDEIGNYIRFFVSPELELTSNFPSSDDVYDIKFFVLDSKDAPDNNKGFIGDSEDTTTDGASYIYADRRPVDQELLSLNHIFNGEQVPVAYPSLATAYNYADGLENAHWVYLAYQAFENDKWNVYLRQIRLSEYSRAQQIQDAVSSGNLVTLSDLGITEVTLRVFCTSDSCTELDNNQYLLTRTVVFEILTNDGREVLNNPDLSGNWASLCEGYSAGEFDRSKVFVQFIHSAVADRCPDLLGFNDIFYNWKSGHEFFTPASSLSGTSLFSLIGLANDSSVDIGSFEPPITVNEIRILSSSVSASYYQSSNETDWSVISDPAFETLSKFKGLDIGEPIPLSRDDEGHSMRPVVKVNYNNDVFVVYENAETGIPQITLKGTTTPSSSLPNGVFQPRNLDATVSSFYSPTDFAYRTTVTTDGINQAPDIFIDLNDVVHLTWQSNKDDRWEIYYANSETNFMEKRITNHEGKSLQPTIDGDDNGRLYIAWHDDRYGNNEIMMGYYLGSRILPLAQQDPYLAVIRNDGYTHYSNEISLVLTNDSNFPVCFNDIIVDFYLERTLENLEFSVAMSEYSFAFYVPSAENDSTTQTWSPFSGWTVTPIGGGSIYESPEWDSDLAGSVISSVFVDYEIFTGGDTVEVSFKASDTARDTGAPWTEYATISDGTVTPYSSLDLTEVEGRYKQMRIKTLYLGAAVNINTVTVISESKTRLCLGPNETVVATLDLTPEIRIDALGTREAEFPIPIGFARNNTYFIGVRAVDDDGSEIDLPDQYAAASCESCSESASTWNSSSCSVKTEISHSNDETHLYNFKYTIYHDPEFQYKIAEFSAFPGSSDLAYFTVDGLPADSVWTDDGLSVDPEISRDIIFWPTLSPTAGLLCGIRYFIVIEYCSNAASELATCSDMALFDSQDWVCNCQSLRWDSRFEDAPVNVRDVVRWRSSGDGSSDTRITETLDTDNINASIQIRSNLNGLILYESNRQEVREVNYDPNTYRVYASVFSVIPRAGMYSTASQNINTAFDSIVFRSEIPICPNTEDFFCDAESNPCDSCYESENRKDAEEFLRGHNVALAIDQFDSIFLAAEVPYKDSTDPIECGEFTKNQQRYIAVHSCGADAIDLFREVDEETGVSTECNPSEILGKTYTGQLDATFRSIVIEMRVRNNLVKYHVHRNNIPMAVVDRCLIDLEIVAIPETAAIRLRNASSNWSEWMPFRPDIGDNAMIVKNWRLSSGSGIKLVEFQAATYSGLSQSGNVFLVADYARVEHEVRFYRPLADSPVPGDGSSLSDLVSNSSIWQEDNRLPSLDGVPVAALRPPLADSDGTIISPDTDYIFVEIEPNKRYVESVANLPSRQKLATFDFTQQGGDDSYNLPTILSEQAGRLIFRGVVQINKDNDATSRDGLAYIIPHFSDDCSDVVSPNVTETSAYEKDSLNQVVSGVPETVLEQADVFDRDDTGRVKYPVTIRPSEDPYFVFGDPNYRLETND